MTDISPGDLVVVVKPAKCGSDDSLGHVFVVVEVIEVDSADCMLCGGKHGPSRLAIEIVDHDKRQMYGYDVSRLKRIDPGEEEETLTRTTEKTA